MGNNLPSISPTESLVMDLLLGGERFGLELVEQSAGGLKRGSVYVILSPRRHACGESTVARASWSWTRRWPTWRMTS